MTLFFLLLILMITRKASVVCVCVHLYVALPHMCVGTIAREKEGEKRLHTLSAAGHNALA